MIDFNKRLVFLFLILDFLLTSCERCDFSIPVQYRKAIGYYNLGDTIYFKSQTGDLDTIMISAIDSIEECGIIMIGKSKELEIEIQHLPKNRWITGTEHTQNGSMNIINQELFSLSKNFDDLDEDYSVHVNYRNFRRKLHIFDDYRNDAKFNDIGVKSYWELKGDTTERKIILHEPEDIYRVFWTEKYGLTEYHTKSGEIYRIVI